MALKKDGFVEKLGKSVSNQKMNKKAEEIIIHKN
jgi:hypothetical protein